MSLHFYKYYLIFIKLFVIYGNYNKGISVDQGKLEMVSYLVRWRDRLEAIMASLLQEAAGHCINHYAFISQHTHPEALIRPSQRVFFRPRPLNTNNVKVVASRDVPCRDIFIEEIKPGDVAQLELMSKFCIDMFFGRDSETDNTTTIERYVNSFAEVF